MLRLEIVGIDDWAWKKGSRYGTIIDVDPERREVLDVLPDREASTTEAWLSRHPGVEYIARDRDGVYAEGARHEANPPGGSRTDSTFFKTSAWASSAS